MTTEAELIKHFLKNQGVAYRQLVQGSDELLANHALFWTERLLLRLVRSLYRKRLREIVSIVDNDTADEVLGVGPE